MNLRSLAPLAAALLASLSGVTSAHASDGPSDVAAVGSPTHETFYGWENIGVSFVGVGITAASWGRSDAGMVAGIGVYALGSPITHAMNGDHGARVGGSLLLNVLTPSILGIVGAGFDRSCSEDGPPCNHHYANAFLLTGAIVAPILDGVLFGWKRAEPKSFAVTPTVTIGRKDDPTSATMVGLSGVF